MSNEPTPSPALATDVLPMIRGFMLSQALHVAAKLSIFDVLRDGPRSVQDIAAACGARETALERLLRFLTVVAVLREDADGRFASTALGETLRSDHPQSTRPLAVMYGEPFFWRSWGELYETITSGEPGFEQVYGQSFFDFLADHPVEAAVFDAGMTSASRVDLPAILGAYDFSAFPRIVDVGGGNGALLRGILERHPTATGVLCDLPSVVSRAHELHDAEVAARCELAATDFFQTVPRDGDAYILKRVLHDWGDDEAVLLLTNVRRAILGHGKVLVMEAVVMASNQPDPAKWMDLNMLAILRGRERTTAEFGVLYAKAGFRLTRVVPAGTLSIIEGVPV